jgi:hypothetical protein
MRRVPQFAHFGRLLHCAAQLRPVSVWASSARRTRSNDAVGNSQSRALWRRFRAVVPERIDSADDVRDGSGPMDWRRDARADGRSRHRRSGRRDADWQSIRRWPVTITNRRPRATSDCCFFRARLVLTFAAPGRCFSVHTDKRWRRCHFGKTRGIAVALTDDVVEADGRVGPSDSISAEPTIGTKARSCCMVQGGVYEIH